jgi:hypothetical protein
MWSVRNAQPTASIRVPQTAFLSFCLPLLGEGVRGAFAMSLPGANCYTMECFPAAALQRCDPVALTQYIDVYTSVHHKSIDRSVNTWNVFSKIHF